jgi:hypothetical protein
VSGRGTDFFVSHAGRDTGWAEWLAWQLQQAGYSVELDVWDWAPGEDFVARMAAALQRADRLLAVCTEAYFASAFGGAELRAAFAQQAVGRIVPVLVEPVTLPPLYAPLIHLDLTGLDEAVAQVHQVASSRSTNTSRCRAPARPPGERPIGQACVLTRLPARAQFGDQLGQHFPGQSGHPAIGDSGGTGQAPRHTTPRPVLHTSTHSRPADHARGRMKTLHRQAGGFGGHSGACAGCGGMSPSASSPPRLISDEMWALVEQLTDRGLALPRAAGDGP